MAKNTKTRELVETTADRAAELTAPLADTAETVTRTAAENVGLTLVGGLVVGLFVGALLPFGRRSRRPKKAAKALYATLAATVSELSHTLATQARDSAEASSAQARDTLSSAGKSIQENSQSLGKQSKKLADNAADQLNDSGKAIAKQLVKLIEKVRG